VRDRRSARRKARVSTEIKWIDKEFRSHGYLKAEVAFNVLMGSELKGKTVSLIAEIKCNLHGIWQNLANIEVV
jgi:desulfoferrodoxin (superoxide reductase-like protein)